MYLYVLVYWRMCLLVVLLDWCSKVQIWGSRGQYCLLSCMFRETKIIVFLIFFICSFCKVLHISLDLFRHVVDYISHCYSPVSRDVYYIPTEPTKVEHPTFVVLNRTMLTEQRERIFIETSGMYFRNHMY